MPPDDTSLQAALEVLKQADFRAIQRLGYHFQPNDFYCPLHDCDFLEQNQAVWAERFEPLAIDWNVDGQLTVAAEVGRHVEELRDVPADDPGPGEFYWGNEFFTRADAVVQYGIARSRQPRRWIEIGCGYSSLLLRKALERNTVPCDVSLIEPYPNPVIFDALPADWRRGKTVLQHVPLEVFDELEAGDVVFYDGSHCAKTGSDVNYFFFKLLPRLKPGVLVHLHDIFLPDPYPAPWIFERGQTWNEQFVLQAFLMHNDAWQVTIANHYLFAYRRAAVEALYRGVQDGFGVSFWMTRSS